MLIYFIQPFKILFYAIRSGLLWHFIVRLFIGDQEDNIGKSFCTFCINMGPFYIKIGQFLSSRPDILGHQICQHLILLQDRIKPFSITVAKKIIDQELGVECLSIFDSFSEPIASASVSQVHKATLKNGRIVAVKILRPNIEKVFVRNLAFIKFVSVVAEKISSNCRRMNLVATVKLLQKMLRLELDMRVEASSANQLAQYIMHDDRVYVPEVLWEYTTPSVLMMEWIDGESIARFSFPNAKVKTDLATKIAASFFNQAFEYGFFHADLHPGNILINKNYDIYYVDFGIMSYLEKNSAHFIAGVLYKFLVKDYYGIAKLHLEYGLLKHKEDLNEFALLCRSIGEPIFDLSPDKISIAKLLGQLFEISKIFNIKLRVDLMMLQKNMLFIESIGRLLAPETNMWTLAEPWIIAWGRRNLSRKAQLYRCIDESRMFYNEMRKTIHNINHHYSSKNHRDNNKIHFVIILALLLVILSLQIAR